MARAQRIAMRRHESAFRWHSSNVIAGLDPAIYLHAKKMDPRVKPAGDAQRCGSTSSEQAQKVRSSPRHAGCDAFPLRKGRRD